MAAISPEALSILRDGTLEGKKLKITDRPLDRELYEEVAEVLRRLGGKWKGGRTKAFVFDLDPAELLAIALETGEMPPDNPLDYYSSTPVVVERMLALIDPRCQPKFFLEPNAGTGVVCKAVRQLFPDVVIHGAELDENRARYLHSHGFQIDQADFFEWVKTASAIYDLIVMNPPFNNGEVKNVYIDHIQTALSLLTPTGLLVSVVPGGFAFRKDKKIAELWQLVESRGGWRKLPQGAFKDSGTGTGALLIWINGSDRPAEFRPSPPPDPEPEQLPEEELPSPGEILDNLAAIELEIQKSLQALKNELFGCDDLVAMVDEMLGDGESMAEHLSNLRELDSPAIAEPEPEFRFEPMKLTPKQRAEDPREILQGCLF